MNNLTAWLRVRNGARFNRQMRSAAKQIRDLGRASDEAGKDTDILGNALGKLSGNIPQLTGRTRLFGFAVGTVVTAGVAVIPIIVGLGGAIVAVAGSLAAATIGAGLFAVAFGGVLGAALGSVGLVLLDAAKNFTAVNERFQTWRQAVKAFGRDSDQAATAQKRLNAVVALSGGPLIMEAVQTWSQLRDEFSSQMQPTLEKIWLGFLQVVDVLRTLMPTWVAFNGIVVDSLGRALKPFLGFLGSSEFKNGLMTIATSFAEISGPLGQGLINIFIGLFRLITRMTPFLGQVAGGVEGITAAFRDWATNGNLNPFIGQLQSWVGLLKAAGALIVTILTGGSRTGQTLVMTLTDTLNQWNAMLSTPGGWASMTKFFSDAANMTKAFLGVIAGVSAALFRFGNMMLPLYTTVFSALTTGWHAVMDALAPAKPFWDNVLGPFLYGIAKAILTSVVGAFKFLVFAVKVFATALGFLGKILAPLKPVFFILGYVIGVVFGGWILKVLSYIGKLSILLKPLGFAFQLLGAPVRLAGAALNGFLSVGTRFTGWIGGILGRSMPALRTGFQAIVSFFDGLRSKFFSIGLGLWDSLKKGILQAVGGGWQLALDIAKAVANSVIDLLNMAIPNKIPIPGAPDLNLPDNPIPKLASGGLVSGMGSWISGEAGPELNTLRNGRVLVQPLPAVSTPAPSSASVDSGGGKRVLVSKVYLRGRQIAEAVADEAEDDIARR